MLNKFETKSARVKGLSFHPKRPWILSRLIYLFYIYLCIASYRYMVLKTDQLFIIYLNNVFLYILKTKFFKIIVIFYFSLLSEFLIFFI
jgi:hypothetical protein